MLLTPSRPGVSIAYVARVVAEHVDATAELRPLAEVIVTPRADLCAYVHAFLR